jgi:hypothetical protein
MILKQVENNNMELDFSSFTQGVYFVRVSNDNSTFVRKIIKE